MNLDNNKQFFFELVRAGLWEIEARHSQFAKIDFSAIYKMSEEQSLVGLVAAGLEHIVDSKVPKDDALTFVGSTLQLEQQNIAMNKFVAELIEKLRCADIYAVLIKGQGVAQCYERPLWRACGDVDLFLSKDNYDKAKALLVPIASEIEEEDKNRMHHAMTIDSFVVELHGTIHGGISKRESLGLETVKKEIIEGGEVRSWLNGKTQVFLPGADNDVFIVFTHILEHFFYGGIGLRQVCDWCRLMWTYRESIDECLLESRIREMGLMTEWKAFAALAVRDLGMPENSMPLYSSDSKWLRKADKIRDIIIETGNFGHNHDNSYYQKHSFLVYKAISLWRNTKDSFRHMMIFPMDALRVWWLRLGEGICVAAKGK